MDSRNIKEDMLRTLEFLDKLNNAITNNNARNIGLEEDIFVQCQQAAVGIGEILERHGERYSGIVSLLELYCEEVYQLSQILYDVELRTQLARQIQSGLHAIKERIEAEYEEKKIIVFLPYKAAMWDSLEGIWQKACEEPDNEVYVIPIPYFDRNEHGGFGEMHCEADMYPSYVPVTSWQEYDLSVRKPDIIYIHNPYDDLNHIMSIHPTFYSENLRQHTEMLIYVPYFVAIGDRMSSHFCTTRAVLYADRVIVQSEAIKKIYIDAITEYEEEEKCKGIFGNLEEKIVVEESSKIVKARTATIDDFTIPEEWNRLIIRPDGSRKKVVFYNVTVQAIFDHAYDVIRKIRYALKIFAEADDIVLLWRPHPFYKETMRLRNPEFVEEYEQIVQEYKAAGWGIFDDTPDFSRAVALSDAYYGDWSSAVEVYKSTGKPIMIQNYNIMGDE